MARQQPASNFQSREAKAEETRKKTKARKQMLKKLDDAAKHHHELFDPTPRLRKKV